MVIDPLEAIITWLETALSSVSGRVAGKHRYGAGWNESQTGVSVHLDGGTPEIYAPVANCRFELRIYADDQVKIMDLYRSLIALSRANKRFSVVTVNGTALVHYFLPTSTLSILYDDVLRMDMGVAFFVAMVGEAAV